MNSKFEMYDLQSYTCNSDFACGHRKTAQFRCKSTFSSNIVFLQFLLPEVNSTTLTDHQMQLKHQDCTRYRWTSELYGRQNTSSCQVLTILLLIFWKLDMPGYSLLIDMPIMSDEVPVNPGMVSNRDWKEMVSGSSQQHGINCNIIKWQHTNNLEDLVGLWKAQLPTMLPNWPP